jgi:hypothetical protein
MEAFMLRRARTLFLHHSGDLLALLAREPERRDDRRLTKRERSALL